MESLKTSRAIALVLFASIPLVAGPRAIGAQDPAALPFTLEPIGPKVWAAIDNRQAKAPASANAGVVVGDDGVAVVDTFASAEAAAALLAEIRKLTPLPVRFVVNTHYHLDHVAGNRVFADAGAVVLAHRNVRSWIQPENLKFFGKDVKPEQKAFIDGLVAPSVVYDEPVNLYLGTTGIHVRPFPGHTGGDSVVLVPDAKVVFGGDLLWRRSLPNTIDASTSAWIETLDALAKDYGGYTFVPGHGGVATTEDVTAFRDYLATLRRLVADAQAQGKAGEALAQAVQPALAEKYGQWDFFKFLADRNIVEMDAELKGTKRIPKP